MNILIACEFSGIVRDAFRNKGHNAVSCDLLPSEKSGPHLKKDIVEVLVNTWDEWDMIIAHPPCTFLTVTGNRWFKAEYMHRFPNRQQERNEAIDFFMFLAEIPIPKIAIENPIGIMSTYWRKPDQIIQPYWFGDMERKSTCLWLKNLPKLMPTNLVQPSIIKYKTRKGTDDNWHINTIKLPSIERMKERSRTFPGIAKAMAEQWGSQ